MDPQNFGSSSKITQNPVGQFGVVQGNGGNLKYGLRLSVFIQASRNWVSRIINRHENLKNLIANQWIHAVVLEPVQANKAYAYIPNLDWEPIEPQIAHEAELEKNEVAHLVFAQ